jgi:hypothetical protein
MSRGVCLLLFAISVSNAGCCALGHPECCPHENGPKTLLAWEVGPKEPEDEKKAEDEKPHGKNGEDQTSKNGSPDSVSLNGAKNGKKNGEEPDEPKELAADRPDFTEASTTVGLGRIQLESGYTYSRNKEAEIGSSHSYPEALLRIGMFAEWFELRLGQNYSKTSGTNPDGGPFQSSGLEDFYVGAKLAMTEQKGYMPELAVILFATVPTGRASLTADRVLPGMSYQYGWDVIKDHLTLAGSTVFTSAVDDGGHAYLETAQSVSVGYTLTEKLGAYTEFFAFFPHGAMAPDVAPEYYFDGGFTYQVTPNFQYDVRAGIGLNRHADDYFLGTGFVIRY